MMIKENVGLGGKTFSIIAITALVVSITALVVVTGGVASVGLAVIGGSTFTSGISSGALYVACGATFISIAALSNKNISSFAKGGKQRINDSSLIGVPDAEIARRLKDRNTPNSEKQRLKKEQKARGIRNRQKREQR